MPLVTSLFLLLASAHLLGRLCVRFKQPALAGHMVAGILLGPSLLEWLKPNPALGTASDVAVLFVVLTAGLEMRLRNIVDVFRGRGAIAMLIGFLLPASLGFGVAYAFSYASITMIVVGLCVAVTALPVALQILSGFDMLRTRIAHISIASSLLADILVFMILGVMMQLNNVDQARAPSTSVALACAKLFGLVAAVVLAQFVCSRLMRRKPIASDSPRVSAANLTFAILFVLALGATSELLGFHFAIGAFFAAMMVTPEVIGDQSFDKLKGTCESLTIGLFGPLFLVYQGLQFDLRALTQPAFVVMLTIVAIFGKLISGYVVGRMQGMNNRDSWGVGIVINARGVMELVIASIAFRANLVNSEIFSVLLAVGLVTTAVTPLLLQRWQATAPQADRETESARTS